MAGTGSKAIDDVVPRVAHTKKVLSERLDRFLGTLGEDERAVREQILCELQAARESMNQMMVAAINMAGQTFAAECERENFVVTGQTNLMEYDELGDMEKLRNLFEAFGRKCDILHLLDQSLTGQGVQRVDVDELYDIDAYKPKVRHVGGKPMFLY